MEEKLEKKSGGFLGAIERVCNKLPSPVMLFVVLFFIVAVISLLCGGIFHLKMLIRPQKRLLKCATSSARTA